MKQNRYKALEQEFKDATLDLDDFLNMDEIEKQDYLDFLREKEARLLEQAESETKRPKLAAKLTKDANKIKEFLDEAAPEQTAEKQTEDKTVEKEKDEKTDVVSSEPERKISKREAKMREKARESFVDPGINKQVNIFIEKNGLDGHRIFYDRMTGKLIDNSAGGQAIASVKELNGILTINGYKIIDKIKEAEKQAIEDVEFAVGDADGVSKVYMVHKKNGNNTIYADFENGEEKESIPIREFQFHKTSYTKEARDKMFQDAKNHADKLKKTVLETVENVRKTVETIMETPTEEPETDQEVKENKITEPVKEPEKPYVYNGKDVTEALKETKAQHEMHDKNMVFHVDGMDFDLKNIKGYTLIALKDMEIKNFDPKSLTVLYDQSKKYGFVIGSVVNEDKNICIQLGKIDEDKNIEYLSDEEIYKQVEVADGKVPETQEEEKAVENKNEAKAAEEHSEEYNVNSKWDEPHEMDAIQVVYSKDGDFFATIYSDGKLHDGHSEYVLDEKSDVGKNIMESLDQIAIASGVAMDDLVVVDGCSYVTTIDGRQVGILSPEGSVLATEIDIREQQILFDFAREHNIEMKDIDTDGKIIFHKDSQEVLAEFSESVQENILSGDDLEMNIDNEKLDAARNGSLEHEEIGSQEEPEMPAPEDPRENEPEEVPFEEAFDQDDMDWGL